MSEVPQELRYQLEDGTVLGSCDWGMCNREQAGWAQSDSDASEDWLAICALCAEGNFAPLNYEPFPVDRYFSYEDATRG